jgi:prophage regulatory protein
MSKKILRLAAVEEKTGLKHSAIYERMHKGIFPKQVRLGPKAVGWLEHEVDAYIERLMSERDAQAA